MVENILGPLFLRLTFQQSIKLRFLVKLNIKNYSVDSNKSKILKRGENMSTGKFNHQAKVMNLINIYSCNPGFRIEVIDGIFKTKRFDGTFNVYEKQYKLYIGDEYIKYGKFYQPERIALLLKWDIEELETYYSNHK